MSNQTENSTYIARMTRSLVLCSIGSIVITVCFALIFQMTYRESHGRDSIGTGWLLLNRAQQVVLLCEFGFLGRVPKQAKSLVVLLPSEPGVKRQPEPTVGSN